MNSTDPIGAFCAYGRQPLQTHLEGPLAGLAFGVKDLYDIAGLPTGAGSPDWLDSHPVPTRTASAVQRLLEAGACCVGKTRTDELAWSLSGRNAHYGTPLNVAAPGRIPGGSSSGSAAAVAANLVAFALGSDTGGSVRLPASFCGLYGLRPTHGRIAIDGAVPLAPSYDAVGWFARDPALFSRVGRVLLKDPGPAGLPSRLLRADDLFGFAGAAVAAALAPGVARIEALLGDAEPVDVTDGAMVAWRNAFGIIQSAEAWSVHGDWIRQRRPDFGPGVRERFAAAATLEAGSVRAAASLRARIRDRMDAIVPPGSVLLLPTARGIAPRLNASAADMDQFRSGALALLCPAGHAGLPQISLPLGMSGGCPLGLSLIGARGEDERLLDLACALGAPKRSPPQH